MVSEERGSFKKDSDSKWEMESYLWIGILAYVLCGLISATVDKYVLKERITTHLVIDFANMLLNSLFILIAAMLFFEITLPTLGQLGFATSARLDLCLSMSPSTSSHSTEADVTRVDSLQQVGLNPAHLPLWPAHLSMRLARLVQLWIGIALLLVLGIFPHRRSRHLAHDGGKAIFYGLLCISLLCPLPVTGKVAPLRYGSLLSSPSSSTSWRLRR
jgi:hypothetical protein